MVNFTASVFVEKKQESFLKAKYFGDPNFDTAIVRKAICVRSSNWRAAIYKNTGPKNLLH